jgi:hypothetical protein
MNSRACLANGISSPSPRSCCCGDTAWCACSGVACIKTNVLGFSSQMSGQYSSGMCDGSRP